jgi:hypothetical protein
MIQVGVVWVLVVGELLLVLAVALASVGVVGFARRRRDRLAAAYLAQVVRAGRGPRDAATRAWLESRYGLEGPELQRAVHDLSTAERNLLQRVIHLYLRRDHLSLRELHIDVEGVTAPLRTLDVRAAGHPPAPAPAAQEDPSGLTPEEAAALAAENEALRQELQITMETMSRMLSEYASMFGGDQGKDPTQMGLEALDELAPGLQGTAAGPEGAETAAGGGSPGSSGAGEADATAETAAWRARRPASEGTAPTVPAAADAEAQDEAQMRLEDGDDTAATDLEAVWAEALAEQAAASKAP